MNLEEQINEIILRVIKNKINMNDYRENKYQVYAFTNENIAGYVEYLDVGVGDKAFSICSGGDHLLNLGVKGISEAHLIDVNPMAEYFTLGIKVPLVLMCSFLEFREVIEFLFKSNIYDLELEKKILRGLLRFMDTKYQEFFKGIFEYYFRLQEQIPTKLKLMQILATDYYFNLEEITFYNLYMRGEEEYNKLRDNLRKMKVRFRLGDVFGAKADDKYKVIMLSNAIEHTYTPDWDMAKLKRNLGPLRDSLEKGGVILADYIYDIEGSERPIGGTEITKRELMREELIRVDNYKGREDGVLVLRK